MSAWPSTLPERPLAAQYGETPQNGAIRSDMDAGPGKVRRRFTATVERFTCGYTLTDAQTETLMVFWRETLQYGSLSFDWSHPRTEDPVSARIVSVPRPKRIDGFYSVALEIEVLP